MKLSKDKQFDYFDNQLVILSLQGTNYPDSDTERFTDFFIIYDIEGLFLSFKDS